MSMRKEPSLKRQGGPSAVLIDDNALDDKRIQGINLMSLGDYDSAKTELNRASIGNKL